uniref:Uncharacterized protein n=1 Tax=Arundo donax TaxID=35708 RepID=A0A0A9EUU1_ARUDO
MPTYAATIMRLPGLVGGIDGSGRGNRSETPPRLRREQRVRGRRIKP